MLYRSFDRKALGDKRGGIESWPQENYIWLQEITETLRDKCVDNAKILANEKRSIRTQIRNLKIPYDGTDISALLLQNLQRRDVLEECENWLEISNSFVSFVRSRLHNLDMENIADLTVSAMNWLGDGDRIEAYYAPSMSVADERDIPYLFSLIGSAECMPRKI